MAFRVDCRQAGSYHCGVVLPFLHHTSLGYLNSRPNGQHQQALAGDSEAALYSGNIPDAFDRLLKAT
jgi:hypothetical protein